MDSITRRLPVGAELLPKGGADFRVWAPRRQRVQVILEGEPGRWTPNEAQSVELKPEGGGYFSGGASAATAGTLYRYQLDSAADRYPDPASRFQPDGPHGPSQVIDPAAFTWTDARWPGVRREGQVIYELHIGTFTAGGTWEAALAELPALADLGITVVEVMPVAEFPGRFGWGYDGVALFAPTRLYGQPDDFRRFVDRAHGLGLGVILDVVYNHLGPDGNYLKQYAEDYFTDRHTTDWGEALNFDDKNSQSVREFFIANAGYWIDEYHLDGLRLDATQNIYDGSADHILSAIERRVRAAGRNRATYLVAENEPQHVKLVRPPEAGGYGLDAVWNDDFHHSARVAMTGHNEAYYTDYRGTPKELLACAKWGYLYQGQWYSWQKKRRGTPAFDVPPAAFVTFIQNHDQIANSGRGQRCHELTSPGRYKALTALTLLGPGTPMLFQGQEFASSSPFLFFADHNEELGRLVCKGRAEFLAQFRTLALPEMQARLLSPADPKTFALCKLDHGQRLKHAPLYEMHRDLLKLRREDPCFRAQKPRGVDGCILGEQALLLRYSGEHGDDRLLVVNLGRDLHLVPAPEPLLAPPEEKAWEVLWSSEDIRYGGCGTAPLESEDGWRLPGEAAVALRPVARHEVSEEDPAAT